MKLLGAVFVAWALAAGPSLAASCRSVPDGIIVKAGRRVQISVRTVGRGRPLLFIPSLGRSVADFDAIAADFAKRGFMSILPEPRGVGASTGPAPATLFDLGEDVASVEGALCTGRIGVVGHAFGNRVARAFATKHPEMVSRLALLAGGGEVPIPPDVMAALEGSTAQGRKPDAERLKDLSVAFFAQGNDPRSWLTGWYPDASASQMATVRATPSKLWWTGGGARILLVQAAEDRIAPATNAEALQRDIGKRLTLVDLAHAGHAMLPEQPSAIAAVLAAYFGDPVPPERDLQRLSDAGVRADPEYPPASETRHPWRRADCKRSRPKA